MSRAAREWYRITEPIMAFLLIAFILFGIILSIYKSLGSFKFWLSIGVIVSSGIISFIIAIIRAKRQINYHKQQFMTGDVLMVDFYWNKDSECQKIENAILFRMLLRAIIYCTVMSLISISIIILFL